MSKKSKRALETILGSRARLRLLKFFFRNQQRFFGMREIIKHLQEDPQLVKKEVSRLLEIGLIVKNTKNEKEKNNNSPPEKFSC